MVDQTRRIVEEFVYCLFRGEHMAPILYYLPPSAPCRTLLLLGRLIGLDFELKEVNILKGEHKTPEFLKLNPQHTIPTFDDHGLVLWESRAIMTYLVAAYAKDDSLYPSDIRVRAVIDQRIQFDLATLYHRCTEYFSPTIFGGAPLDDGKRKRLDEALGFFEEVMHNRMWVAADHFTVADLTLTVTLSQIDGLGFDLEPFVRVRRWFDRCRAYLEPYGYEELNQAGLNTLIRMLNAQLNK